MQEGVARREKGGRNFLRYLEVVSRPSEQDFFLCCGLFGRHFVSEERWG
jgi:hypothetical protein